jgi:hypothetical protein
MRVTGKSRRRTPQLGEEADLPRRRGVRPKHVFIGAPTHQRKGRIPFSREFVRRRNRIRNLIAGQGLPFETLCIESCLTAVVVITGGLAVGHGVFERDPGGL